MPETTQKSETPEKPEATEAQPTETQTPAKSSGGFAGFSSSRTPKDKE